MPARRFASSGEKRPPDKKSGFPERKPLLSDLRMLSLYSKRHRARPSPVHDELPEIIKKAVRKKSYCIGINGSAETRGYAADRAGHGTAMHRHRLLHVLTPFKLFDTSNYTLLLHECQESCLPDYRRFFGSFLEYPPISGGMPHREAAAENENTGPAAFPPPKTVSCGCAASQYAAQISRKIDLPPWT